MTRVAIIRGLSIGVRWRRRDLIDYAKALPVFSNGLI